MFFAFTNNANAIVDTNLNDTKTQTEQTPQKKKFLKRIFTEKNDDKTTSKDEITFKIEEQTNTLNIKENSTLTLDDCIKIALENSPSIQKYQDLVTVANSLLGQSKSSYFPSLTLGTGYYGSYSSSSGRSESDSSYGVDASLKQLIFSFGKVGARIKKAKLNKIAADYDLNYEIIKTIFNVKTNYYAVLAASANIKVQEANILVNERQYQQTKAYFEEGLKSKIDLVNSEVYLSNAKIDLVSAQNSYDTAVVALNNSMYLDYSPKYSIAKLENFNFDNKYANVALKHTTQNLEKFEAPVLKEGATYQTIVQKNEILNEAYKVTKFPYTLEDSIKIAKEHRPDLKSYIAAKEALKEELKYQKIQYLPDINAKGGYGLTANDNNTNSFRIQGTLDFPNINVMDIKYKVDEAKAKLENEYGVKAGDSIFFIADEFNKNITIGVERMAMSSMGVTADIYIYLYDTSGTSTEKMNINNLKDAIKNKNYNLASTITKDYLGGSVTHKQLQFMINSKGKQFKYQVLTSKILDY